MWEKGRIIDDAALVDRFFEGGLSLHFTSQITNVYCGVASMTVVFNALGLPFEERPQSPLMKPGGFRYFDQNNVFNGCMRDVMHEAGIYQSPWGITLKQLKEYFGCRTGSDYRGGDDFKGGAKELSRVLAREMSTPGHFLVANYHRKAIGQTGGGHHSPLGSYSPSKDMVLIMDVARLVSSVWGLVSGGGWRVGNAARLASSIWGLVSD